MSAAPTTTVAATAIPLKRKKTDAAAKTQKNNQGNEDEQEAIVESVAPAFTKWRRRDAMNAVREHWLPVILGGALLFFMWVEYTLRMVPTSSQPFDLGFVATRALHRLLSSSPELNSVLAALNTVFVGMQTSYILWTFVVEGRGRPTISALFMFTCRGILGYSTQLPLPEGYLGSGVDFPVGNVSFFLFFSGHVAGSVIASQDMRRMQRWELALGFEFLNALQVVRLLATRGHYTIDLAAGYAAGLLFDSLAGRYLQTKTATAAALLTTSPRKFVTN
uniref:Phosphatidylcholine:diacylglycerol cholinephosphotransferase 1 n=1 Tax=Linum usitatissimum TaxID=4006 RepID=A0A0H3U1R3_LINUS|nr:phosphatidylcholine:diacylglycerol cholinephosphotransferase 1 [Linum usitatissimum]